MHAGIENERNTECDGSEMFVIMGLKLKSGQTTSSY